MGSFTGRGNRNGNGRGEGVQAPEERQEKKKPVFTYEVPVQGGRLNLAVWESTHGEGKSEKVSSSVTMKRSYFDTSKNQWNDTAFIRQGDLPALSLALQYVYQRILDHEQP